MKHSDPRRSLIAGVCLAATLVLVAAPSVPLAAQKPAPQQPMQITFRAVSDDGTPAIDLKASDVSLKVNGKPRTIESLAISQSLTGAGDAKLPPPYATNAAGRNGRTFYVLIDDDSIATGREADVKDALRRFTLELAPGDRVGVLNTQGTINLRPVDDVAKINAAIDRISGQSSQNETDAAAQCRTTRVLGNANTLLSLSRGSAATILVFSAGLTSPAEKIVNISGNRRQAASGATTSDTCPVRPDDYENLGANAAASQADFYVFGMTQASAIHNTDQDAGLLSFASATGGQYLPLAGNAQALVSRMLRETSAFYVATFAVDAAERNGQPARVELKSSRDHVTLRAHPSIVLAKDVVTQAVAPKDMLRTGEVFIDLPLRAAGYSSRGATGDVKVVALFETLDPSITIKEASFALFDEGNTLKKQWTGQPADLARRPVVAAVTAPPGVYRLRVAAVDSTGREGTVDYSLNANLVRADPVQLSALVLGTQVQGKGFTPRLEFSSEPIAIGYLEIYGVPKGGNVTVALDILKTADGAAVASAATNVNPAATEDARIAFGGFDISSLSPGDYLMRATVTLDGKAVGRVERTMRKK